MDDNLIFDKIRYLLCKIISSRIKCDLFITDINDLSMDILNSLKKSGIKALIIDVDETLRYDMKPISEVNVEWLKNSKNVIKISIVSNGYDRGVEKLLETLDIPYYKMAYKPLKRNLKKVLSDLDVNGSDVMVIGNDYFTDIYGGYRIGSKTCLIKKK